MERSHPEPARETGVTLTCTVSRRESSASEVVAIEAFSQQASRTTRLLCYLT
jgi:hypothetical protein